MPQACRRSRGSLSSAERLDIDKALELQDIFHQVRAKQGLPLKDALRAVYASFLDQTFTMQIGLLLLRLERPFALQSVARRLGSTSDGGVSDVDDVDMHLLEEHRSDAGHDADRRK